MRQQKLGMGYKHNDKKRSGSLQTADVGGVRVQRDCPLPYLEFKRVGSTPSHANFYEKRTILSTLDIRGTAGKT